MAETNGGRATGRQPLAWLRLDPTMLCSHETVCALSFAQLGLHASLLEPAWYGDGLPEDPSTLLQVRARGAREFRRLWSGIEYLWPLGADGRRRNPWLEQQRAESLAIREQKAKNRRGSQQPTDERATAVERPSAQGERPFDGAAPTQPNPPEPTGPNRPDKTEPTSQTHTAAPEGHEPTGRSVSEGVPGSVAPQELGPEGSGGSEGRISGYLLNSTTWRSNARDRLLLVFRLAKRLELEGMKVEQLQRLWGWSRRNAHTPEDPGGYFDTLVASENAWRGALQQADRVDLTGHSARAGDRA